VCYTDSVNASASSGDVATRSDLETVATWSAFRKRLRETARSRVACRLAGELCPFPVTPPEPLALLEAARSHPKARLLRQAPGDAFDPSADCGHELRAMPLEELAREPLLHLSLFELDDLRREGGVLHALDGELLRPLEALWQARGARWEGAFWPILFVGGARSATNYHIDPTPNITIHLFGAKRFHGLKEPDRWAPESVKVAYLQHGTLAARPEGLRSENTLVHDNAPGDLVWVPRLTPHWVDAGSLSATLTIAFRDFGLEEEDA
jgi:hypothetical protein